MIGFYDYTVILTYMSVASALIGMMFAAKGRVDLAIICLMFSGLCDGFDGKVARCKKNRTDHQKMFGLQIDSLCDVISFGVFPVVICHFLGMRGNVNDVIKVAYVLAAVIRLAYYNVMEEEAIRTTEHSRDYFQGLPVTSISIILPVLYVINHMVMGKESFGNGYSAVMFIITVLFILDIKIKKPSVKLVAGSLVITLFLVGYIVYHYIL